MTATGLAPGVPDAVNCSLPSSLLRHTVPSRVGTTTDDTTTIGEPVTPRPRSQLTSPPYSESAYTVCASALKTWLSLTAGANGRPSYIAFDHHSRHQMTRVRSGRSLRERCYPREPAVLGRSGRLFSTVSRRFLGLGAKVPGRQCRDTCALLVVTERPSPSGVASRHTEAGDIAAVARGDEEVIGNSRRCRPCRESTWASSCQCRVRRGCRSPGRCSPRAEE